MPPSPNPLGLDERLHSCLVSHLPEDAGEEVVRRRSSSEVDPRCEKGSESQVLVKRVWEPRRTAARNGIRTSYEHDPNYLNEHREKIEEQPVSPDQGTWNSWSVNH